MNEVADFYLVATITTGLAYMIWILWNRNSFFWDQNFWANKNSKIWKEGPPMVVRLPILFIGCLIQGLLWPLLLTGFILLIAFEIWWRLG